MDKKERREKLQRLQDHLVCGCGVSDDLVQEGIRRLSEESLDFASNELSKRAYEKMSFLNYANINQLFVKDEFSSRVLHWYLEFAKTPKLRKSEGYERIENLLFLARDKSAILSLRELRGGPARYGTTA